MKTILILPLFLLVSCASTKFYQDGKLIAKFNADMDQVQYIQGADGSITWTAISVDHSTATKAQGEAFSSKTTAIGSAVAASGVVGILLR